MCMYRVQFVFSMVVAVMIIGAGIMSVCTTSGALGGEYTRHNGVYHDSLKQYLTIFDSKNSCYFVYKYTRTSNQFTPH